MKDLGDVIFSRQEEHLSSHLSSHWMDDFSLMCCRLSGALHFVTILVIGHQRGKVLALKSVFSLLFQQGCINSFKGHTLALRNVQEPCGNSMCYILILLLGLKFQ